MNKKKTVLSKQIRKLFKATHNQKSTDSINIRNIRNVYTFSLMVCIFDAISLVLFSVTNWDSAEFRRTFFNVFYCIVSCTVIAILSKNMINKYRINRTISNTKSSILVTFFYTTLSVWGILVDIAHYRDGDQMLTFYIVQFCFVCFVVMQPKIGAILISLAYFVLYLGIYFVDGAANIQPQNYLIFAIIAVCGNAIQYMMLEESEKHKIDILELNQILQQEASIDALTNLKNRTALRNDFKKHIGKDVYTIMADVDRFKNYNDIYGHAVGDEVLRLVASATNEIFWNGDVYRYGGDEFLIVITEPTDKEFEEKTKKWKEAILSIKIPNVTQAITISYGYERGMMRDSEDLKNAIKIADERLYKAKRMRCNAVAD